MAIYDSNIENIAISGVQDLYEVLAPSDAVVLIHEVNIEQGDVDTGEQLRVICKRVTGAPTSGSGGGTITPSKRSPTSAAAGATVERNNSTILSGGTQEVVASRGFNILNGLPVVFDPPVEISPSTRFVVGLSGTPAASTSFNCQLMHEELGG